MTNEEIITYKFSAEDNTAAEIEKKLAKVVKYAMANDNKLKRIAELNFSQISLDEDYDELNKKITKAMLIFSAEKSGISEVSTQNQVLAAFSNPLFKSIFNSIIVETLQSIVLGSRPEQIWRLANVVDVPVGGSHTFELDTKGLPIAQKTSYTSNVTFLDGHAKSSITVVPSAYSIGTTMDYTQILDGNYDMGRELARVASALLYAQLKLIVEQIYAIANVNGTPLYQAAWSKDNYVQMIEDLKMLNGDATVTAYGTLSAFSKMGSLATTNYGFVSQDEMIKTGFLGTAYGVDNVVLDQFTDLSQPYTTANAASLRTIPSDRILLLSSVNDKPVKLVREDFIHAIVKQPTEGAQYRINYEYFMSFDAAIATQAHYGIQAVNA